MKMRLIVLLLSPFIAFGQQVDSLIFLAAENYEIGEYGLASDYYDMAFELDPENRNFYNAACSNSLAGRNNRAIELLNTSFERGEVDFAWMYFDTDLNPLRNDLLYKEFEEKYNVDSILYFHEIVELLEKTEGIVDTEGSKYISLPGWFNDGEPNGNIGIQALIRIGQRYGVGIVENRLDFQDKTLTIDGGTNFYSTNINKAQILENLTLRTLVVSGQINGQLVIRNLKAKNLVLIDNSLDKIGIDSCEFEHVFISESGNNLFISNTKILSPKKWDDPYWLIPHSISAQSVVNTKAYNMVRFKNLTIERESPLILEFEARKFEWINSTVYSPIQFKTTITDYLKFQNNTFEKPVSFSEMKFPEFNCQIPFNQFQKDLVTFDIQQDTFYTIGNTNEAFRDRESYGELVSIYKTLYTNYRNRGDLESANASYVRLKEMEVLQAKLKENKTTEETIRLYLNQIMGFYTDYGTSPGKALIVSFYIVLAFSLVYFFFPSEWDVSSKGKLISDFQLFIQKNEHGYVKPLLVLLAGFLVSFLNAITLSMNSFVTLGFGAIPTTGLARYLCVIEGLLGWFLLSLFSVALINQVLL